MFDKKWYEFKPISYVGMVLVFGSIVFMKLNDSNNAYIMTTPVIILLVGIYLIHKGRKKRGNWE